MYLYACGLARTTHMITQVPLSLRRLYTDQYEEAAATRKQLIPLTVDSSNSPGLYLRPGIIILFSKGAGPPSL